MRLKTKEESVLVAFDKKYKDAINDIKLTAILNRVYELKMSNEIVNMKVKNQLNAINFSINQINPKFTDKSKNYGKISNSIMVTIVEYEKILKRLCDLYDKKLDELILKKVEIETKIFCQEFRQNLSNDDKVSIKKKIVKSVNSAVERIKGKIKKNKIVDVGLINKLQDGQDIAKEISNTNNLTQDIIMLNEELFDINNKIQELSKEKENKLINALEYGEKSLSTDIKKPRAFKKITKFFANRFNTYNVIMRTVISPINQRIENFQDNEEDFDYEENEFDLSDFSEKVNEIQKNIFSQEKI